MSRRLGPLLLALLLAATSIGVCARGVRACSMPPAASHDCCSGKSLWANDCCCAGKAQRSAAVPDNGLTQASSTSVVLASGPAVLPAVPAALSSPTSVVLARAFAPPDTPVSRHTSLLL